MTDWRKRQDRYVDDPELGAIMELEPIEIEGSVSRANTTELDPIDIQGSRSADVQPYSAEEARQIPMPARGPRRADGVSTMLPEWVPPWATEAVGQPVEGMGGTTDYEVPEWLGELLADSEGQMPTSMAGSNPAPTPCGLAKSFPSPTRWMSPGAPLTSSAAPSNGAPPRLSPRTGPRPSRAR